jgi:predicted DsbA family dithiol-disulfide isomerase
MHDKLFSNQNELDAGRLPSYARELRLNDHAFQTCLENGAEDAKVRADVEMGQKAGISGTPAFLLGLTDSRNSGLLKVNRKIIGAQSYSVFKAAIDSLLEAEQVANRRENALR